MKREEERKKPKAVIFRAGMVKSNRGAERRLISFS